MERIVAGLNELQPTILMCYSSFLPHLAAEAQAGRLAISPRRVIAISEPLLPEVRATATSVWGAPVANGYGMSEGLFAGSCAFGIHLPDDLCLIERVDARGRPAAPGSPSQRIYLTNLYNHALPLIRFEVTDELSEPEASCPCGSALRRIQDPQGRLDDTFLYDGGISVHPHVFRTALGRHPQILEYQVRQTARGADIKLIAPAGLDTLTLQHTIGQLLAAVGLHEAAVTVTLAAALDRQASGKLKRFVPLSA
jgi:phenylacetate-CoA ligase